jgi:hypothetical protein
MSQGTTKHTASGTTISVSAKARSTGAQPTGTSPSGEAGGDEWEDREPYERRAEVDRRRRARWPERRSQVGLTHAGPPCDLHCQVAFDAVHPRYYRLARELAGFGVVSS